MKEYEIIIETINPCGGTKHAQNEIIEAEAESPEAYIKEHGIFPVILFYYSLTFSSMTISAV